MRMLFAALIFFALAADHPAAAADQILDAPTALDQMRSGDLTVIDIRRPDEWRTTGIADGAQAITMHDPQGQGAFLANVLASVDGDKSTPIGLICASGVRSTWAVSFLTRNGFTNLYNIKEGMLGRGPAPGWIKRDLPVKPYTN